MRICTAFLILTLVPVCRGGTPSLEPAKAVAYAKSIDVSRLDQSIRSRRLDDWLREGPAKLEDIEWRLNDCDLAPEPATAKGGHPVCMKIVYHRNEAAGWLLVKIGTDREGIAGDPHFEYALVSVEDAGVVRTERTEILSQLPTLIATMLAEKK